MKPSRIALLAAMALVVALAALFLLAPEDVHLEGEVTMRSNTETVGPYVSDLREWHGWTSWLDPAFDPGATVAFTGEVPGVGDTVRWRGPKVGHGRVEVTEADETGGIVYRGEVDGFAGTGRVSVKPEAGGTVRVHWLFDGEAPAWNLLARVRAGATRRRFDGWIKGSLARLADLSEHTLRPPGRLPKQTVVKVTPDLLK